jgi:hypothetical protein
LISPFLSFTFKQSLHDLVVGRLHAQVLVGRQRLLVFLFNIQPNADNIMDTASQRPRLGLLGQAIVKIRNSGGVCWFRGADRLLKIG